MRISFIILLLSSFLNTACAGESEKKWQEKKKSSLAATGNEIDRPNLSQDIELPLIPNTQWDYVNLEGVHKMLNLFSKNEFDADDDLGNRKASLLIQSQINRGIGYPAIRYLSRNGPLSCDDLDQSCKVTIHFLNYAEETLPAKINNNGIINDIYIYDDDFLEKLKQSDELVVQLPISLNKTERMVFDIRGFKSELLEFDSE